MVHFCIKALGVMGALRLKLQFQSTARSTLQRLVKRSLQGCLTLAATFGFLVAVQAASVTGSVRITPDGPFLQLTGTTQLFKIIPTTEEAVRTLGRLVHNDFLQGQGEFQSAVFLLQTVDFVGLYHLLGPWQSKQDRALVTFENFNTLSIFNPRTLGYDRVAVFDYSVAPDKDTHWKIFVAGGKSVSIASMRLESERLVLQFIDLETGAFEKPLELVRKNP